MDGISVRNYKIDNTVCGNSRMKKYDYVEVIEEKENMPSKEYIKEY
ncbi:MAG: hypothetical protein K2K85_02475 [Clostridia bacterium]|nr:hypothetical protein [Clostridia bacterium]